MPYRDPQKQRQYQREHQHKQRSSGKVGYSRAVQALVAIEDLRLVFERITNEMLNDEDLDLGIEARVIAQVLKVGIELLDGRSLEQRVEELEKRYELSKYA
jgi:hypothetical protein